MGIPSSDTFRLASRDTVDPELSRKFSILAELTDGRSLSEVSAESGVGEHVLAKWWRIASEGGIEALEKAYPAVSRRPEEKPLPAPADKEQDASSALLALSETTDDHLFARRLIVVAALLRGRKGADVACIACLPTSTVTSWLQFYRERGVEALRPKSGHRDRGADRAARLAGMDIPRSVEALRRHMGHNAGFDRRLTAVIAYLETGDPKTSAERAAADGGTVLRWVDHFLERGVEGLMARGQKPKI